MAGSSTVSIGFKIEDGDGGLKKLVMDGDALRKVMQGAVKEAEQLKGNVIKFPALSTGVKAMRDGFGQLQVAMKDLCDAYAVQETAELKLATVMRQRMGASEEEIQSIKDLASAQQEIGVIGDEVQLSGAQQVATFLKQKGSIDTLLPAMNNLLAQQKGLDATTQDAVGVANLMGKAMQGQTSALTRVGITFTDAQARVMKYGTESERAAMLAQIITDNVGDMNQQLAQTESGRQQQLANTLGDVKEQIGGMVNVAMPFVTIISSATSALVSVGTLVSGLKTMTATVWASVKAFTASTVAFVKNKGAALALAAAQKTVKIATAAWAGVQQFLNLVLSANPIGILIVAVGALVSAIVYAYKNFDGFRQVVDKAWSAVKPLATAIMKGLCKALDWLAEKCRVVWNWLKDIFGLGGKEIKVTAKVSAKKDNAPGMDLGGLEQKYAKAGGGKAPGARTPKAPKTGGGASDNPVLRENAETLKEIEENVFYYDKLLEGATEKTAAEINEQKAHWESLADKIRAAGKNAENLADTPIDDKAGTLSAIGKNIDILNAKRQTASSDEIAALNDEIAKWEEKRAAMENATNAVSAPDTVNEGATKLGDINKNISILQSQLESADATEAAGINRNIKLWQDKADAIRNAGLEAEETGRSIDESLKSGWSGVKGMKSGIDSITEALNGNKTVWETLQGVIDGFFSLFDNMKQIIGIIQMLTGVTRQHSAATQQDTVQTVANTAATETSSVAASTNTAAKAGEGIANATAEGAKVPFPGNIVAIAAGVAAVVAAIAMIASVGKFASGGIVGGNSPSGDKLYARVNSGEMILNKTQQSRLFRMIAAGPVFPPHDKPMVTELSINDKYIDRMRDSGTSGGTVKFRIEGRALVGILDKETNLKNRS